MYPCSVQGGEKQLFPARAALLPVPSSCHGRTANNRWRARREIRAVSETPSRRQIILARVALWLIAIFAAFGIIRLGLKPGTFDIFWHDIRQRPGGTMTFRFILQPCMAAFAAFRDGLKDARAGRSPYLWTVLSSRPERMARLNEGLISTAQIILLGLVMDGIYQFIVLKTFYPGQAVVIALVLAFIPYVLLRGPVARILHWRQGKVYDKENPHGR
jgi:hypothetical protein